MMLLRMLNVIPPGMDETPYPPKEELEKIKDELVGAAEAFLRGGGIMISDDWHMMGPYEKAAMIFAGNALRDEMAVQIGRCTLDPKYREALEATYDGGEALKRQSYEEALTELLEQMKRVNATMEKHAYVPA